MRTLRILGVVFVALLAMALVFRPADSQDDTDQRITALESRVATLEADVASLRGEEPESQILLDTYTLRGEIRLVGDEGVAWDALPNGACQGRGQYGNLGPDGSIAVLTGSNLPIGGGDISSATQSGNGCLITFEVGVMKSDVYKVEVAEGDFVTYTFADLESDGWSISITRMITG